MSVWDWMVVAVFPGANDIPLIVGIALLALGVAALVFISPLRGRLRKLLGGLRAPYSGRPPARRRGAGPRVAPAACARGSLSDTPTMLLARVSDDPDATIFLPPAKAGRR